MSDSTQTVFEQRYTLPPAEYTHAAAIETILQTIGHALAVCRASGPVLESAYARKHLQPQMRRAEAAVHRLRSMDMMHLTPAAELAQALTVLVLMVDMAAAGQIDDPVACGALLQRSVRRTSNALHQVLHVV